MLDKFQRPLTEGELKSLSELLAKMTHKPGLLRMLGWFALWSGICVLCFVLFGKALSKAETSRGIWPMLSGVLFIAGILSFYVAYQVVSGFFSQWRHQRHSRTDTAPKIRAALENGNASVTRVEASGVIVIDEDEDVGSSYIYDLGDGTSLCLPGGNYYPDDEDAPWPARQFEIARTVAGDQLLGVSAAKTVLEPTRMLSIEDMPKKMRETYWSNLAERESVLPGNPAEVLARLSNPKVD